MSLFVLADTHLSLANEKPMDIFGDRWKDHTEKIKKGFEAVVSEGDTVVICGDVSWAMTKEEALPDLRFLDGLPGKKLISKGNHDFYWDSVGKMKRFLSENGIETIRPIQNEAVKVGDKIVCASRGWFLEKELAPKDTDYKKLINREVLRIKMSAKEGRKLGNGEMILFLHFPPALGDEISREILDTVKEEGIKKVYCGHVHGRYDIPAVFEREGVEIRLASADYLDFVPLLVR